MSKIYGFGNALIDIEITVSEEQLKNTNINKGLMKHISQEELEMYLKSFTNQVNSALPGGSIANSMHAANKHNIETHFSCAIGDDEYGEIFINSFEDKLSGLSFYTSKLPTGICLIFITPDGQRTMAANLGANTDLHKDCIDINKLKYSEYLLFDNFALSTEKGFKIAKFCLSLNQYSKVCFGISDVSLVEENSIQLKELFNDKIDILYGNEPEITSLMNTHRIYSSNILTTFGADGAKFNKTRLDAPEIKIANSNGAGDALIGSFLANRINNLDIEDSLQDAISYASKVCTTNGPRL